MATLEEKAKTVELFYGKYSQFSGKGKKFAEGGINAIHDFIHIGGTPVEALVIMEFLQDILIRMCDEEGYELNFDKPKQTQ